MWKSARYTILAVTLLLALTLGACDVPDPFAASSSRVFDVIEHRRPVADLYGSRERWLHDQLSANVEGDDFRFQ